MSKSDSHAQKRSAAPCKELVENRLDAVGVRVTRSVSVEDGTKKTLIKEHTDPSKQTYPGLVDGNCSIHCGDELVALDIDDHSKLPQHIRDLPETFTIETVHGGEHRYYALDDDSGISSTKTAWGSIRYEGWYTLAPGSTIDHARCDDDKGGCPGHGLGTYDPSIDLPIAILSGDDLDALWETCGSADETSRSKGEEYGGNKITLPEDDLVEITNHILCSEILPKTDLFGEDLMDLLRGGTGQYVLRRDNDPNSIDQSAADYYALDGLYGAFLDFGYDPEEAKRITVNIFKHYCRENPHDKTGNLRKWLRKGESYLTGEGVDWDGQMDVVVEEFDFGPWYRWRRQKHEGGFDHEEHRPWTDPDTAGRPSDTTTDTIRATMQILTKGRDIEDVQQSFRLDLNTPTPSCREVCTPRQGSSGTYPSRDSRRYPTAKEVGKFAAELNPERKATYFTEVVKKLSRETDEVAHAYCPYRPNGECHVYYPNELPDPEDARWVKVAGEERDIESATIEQELRADGGIRTGTSHDIRDTNDGADEPKILMCPVPGCSRTTVDDETGLRNHVRHTNDELHSGLILDDEMQLADRWGDWSPGYPDDPDFDAAPKFSSGPSIRPASRCSW